VTKFSGAGNLSLSGGQLFRSLYWRALEANVIGAALAFVYLSFISPPQDPPPEGDRVLYLGVAPAYVLVVALVGYQTGKRRFQPIGRWLADSRAPTPHERALVLSLPWRTAGHAAVAWLGAAVIFGVVTATHHPAIYVAGTAAGIALAGLTTAAVTFLLGERAMRPVFVLALAGQVLRERESAGILGTGSRLLVSWALGSGIAFLAIALAFLGRGESTGDELIWPVLFLVGAGLFAGGLLLAGAARSVSERVAAVSAAVERVERGSLEQEVVVDDGGEIGFLQAGFNRMLAGLRERAQIREAFGTYVDAEVAEHILKEGTALEGEEVDVTLMFIDIRDFTGFAERRSAPEVVTTLNRLWESIVPVIHAHSGHVDKFIGDGLLGVFGAPRRVHEHADQALAAALEIVAAVEDEFQGELSVGVGLNSGVVVAGNVGGAGRFDFSVIGDAVNVAARVEAATRQTGDPVLVSEHTRRLLTRDDVELQGRQQLRLKGKQEAIVLYAAGTTATSPLG
jgi:adenylate cyclase